MRGVCWEVGQKIKFPFPEAERFLFQSACQKIQGKHRGVCRDLGDRHTSRGYIHRLGELARIPVLPVKLRHRWTLRLFQHHTPCVLSVPHLSLSLSDKAQRLAFSFIFTFFFLRLMRVCEEIQSPRGSWLTASWSRKWNLS